MGQITDKLDGIILKTIQEALDGLIPYREATRRVREAQANAEEERENEQHHRNRRN